MGVTIYCMSLLLWQPQSQLECSVFTVVVVVTTLLILERVLFSSKIPLVLCNAASELLLFTEVARQGFM